MALTELQLPEKGNFYGNLQAIATAMERLMAEWEMAADFINTVTAADLDAMGVATGTVRSDLIDFRQSLVEMINFYSGDSTTQTVVPKTVVSKIRRMK